MEDGEPQNLNTAFNGSFRLTLLYFVLGTLNCSGFVTCCTLAKLFKQYHFNHANFSVVFSNLFICLSINNIIQLGRVITIFFQWLSEFDSEVADMDENQKCSISVMNNSITFFILGGCIFCLIERTYATMNYIKYEHEDYSNTIYKTFNIMWLIVCFILFINAILSLSTFSSTSYYNCILNEIKNDPIKLNWQIFVCTICMMAFLLFFILLLRTNIERRAKSERPQAQYRLGTAYQLRENCYGIRLMIWFSGSFLTFLVIYLYHIQNLYINYAAVQFVYDVEYVVFWKEFGLLYYALFSIIMPSAIIFSSAAICRRLNDLWQTFCQNWKFAV
uniref:G-protein coupled receptors family 1 profile domain-containing protein n=1 Tax=Panagrolaimus sp. PS1159 TaxID=55785 RepID=A0AC35GEA6_9BILA